MLAFWMIFVTLMLPVEVRILPTYKVVSDLHMLDTYAGLTVPLIASATATFLFRQFFLTIPDELAEAARIDGAGPMRFFWDVVVPLSRPNIAALFVILFIFGWNQYLWPLLVTTDESMYTTVIGIKRMIAGGDAATEWNLVMATAMLAMLPPALVVLLMQRWFVKGLVDTRESDADATRRAQSVVIPAKAGIQGFDRCDHFNDDWVPAFAEMTGSRTSSSARNASDIPARNVARFRASRHQWQVNCATSARATAARGDPRRTTRSPTASSSSSSGPRAAASRRCCAWSRGSRRSPAARSSSATAWSTSSSPRTATSRWCSRTTRSIRT